MAKSQCTEGGILEIDRLKELLEMFRVTDLGTTTARTAAERRDNGGRKMGGCDGNDCGGSVDIHAGKPNRDRRKREFEDKGFLEFGGGFSSFGAMMEEALGSMQSQGKLGKPGAPSSPQFSALSRPPAFAGGAGGSDGGEDDALVAGWSGKQEQYLEGLRRRAVELQMAHNRVVAGREAACPASSDDHEVAVLRTREAVQEATTVRAGHASLPTVLEANERNMQDESDVESPPAGRGAGGKTSSAEPAMKQVKALYQRVIEHYREGRPAEAMACLQTATSLEADLLKGARETTLVETGDADNGMTDGLVFGRAGGFTFRTPHSTNTVKANRAASLGPPTAQTVYANTQSGVVPSTNYSANAVGGAPTPAANLEPAQRKRKNDDLFALLRGGVFNECTPEQKSALSAMMKQHAEQFSDLRAGKRELDKTIKRQADILSAALEASDRQMSELKAEKEDLQTERQALGREMQRLRTEMEEVRESAGPLAAWTEKSRQTLRSLPGLQTLLEECVICSDVLLSSIGRESFGAMSYSCGCTQVRTMHVACIVSMSSLDCPYCGQQVVIIAPSLMAQTAVRSMTVRKNVNLSSGV